jgi:hypothetical protein
MKSRHANTSQIIFRLIGEATQLAVGTSNDSRGHSAPGIENRANDHRAGNCLSSVLYQYYHSSACRIARADGNERESTSLSPDDDEWERKVWGDAFLLVSRDFTFVPAS